MRSLQNPILEDLPEKFVFLSGPRQVGKTHLAESVARRLKGKYYNWDAAEDREKILQKNFLRDGMVVLDELHKYQRWKSFLKGIYDKHHQELQVLVTGSARLDHYQKGGDSMLGRYFHYHLHPLSVGELLSGQEIPGPQEFWKRDVQSPPDLLRQLSKFGGFPEPFYKATERFHNRWSIQRRELLVREDVRDLTQVQLLSLIEHLLLLLPQRVASVLSVNSLREELRVSYNTVQAWLDIFEKLYLTYRLGTVSQNLSRSIHKEKKLYLWDWSQVPDPGARFENLVASHLLKAVQLWRDQGEGDFDLGFVRDRDRREVDFCLLRDRKPWILVEAKLAETRPSEHLEYFSKRWNLPAFQVIEKPDFSRQYGDVRVVSADRFLAGLP